MAREQKQLIAFIILFSIVIILWMGIIFKPRRLPEEVSPEQPGSMDLSGTGGVDFFELEKTLKDNRPPMEWVRDPFHFPQKQIKKADVADLTLTGIIYDKESPMAVINDVIIHEGDMIGGAVVKEIRSDSVVLEKAGRSYTLELMKGEK